MKHICVVTILIIAITGIEAHEEGQKVSTERSLKISLDDGNVIEEIDPLHVPENTDNREEPTLKIQSNEKGTHQFGRAIIKPFINVAKNTVSGAASKIGKAFSIVSHTAGLDTNTTFFSGPIDSFKRHIKMIYPGTRWCGDGDKASSDDDLGLFKDTDKCCRAHDKCFDSMAAGETKYDLHNTGLFTRSHCECDVAFYNCLKEAKDLIAKKIGFTYFTVLGPQCFKEEDFVTGCTQYSRGKCIKYRTDPTKARLFQWFDSPLF